MVLLEDAFTKKVRNNVIANTIYKGSSNDKVLKAGDTMTGALVITAANVDDIIPLTINQLDTTAAKNALNIVNSGIGKGMYIDQNANGRALDITSDSTTQSVLIIDAGSLTTASALRIRSDSEDTSSRNVAIIINDNVLAVGAVALTVQQDSTGNGIFLDQNGDGIALHIDNDGTANAITVEGTTATDFTVSKAGDVYIAGDCSALTFTDRTPFYVGDAISELGKITAVEGKINHDSLPAFAKNIKIKDIFEPKTIPVLDKDRNITFDEDGKIITEVILEKHEEIIIERNLGAMISILTVAIQQLNDRITKLER